MMLPFRGLSILRFNPYRLLIRSSSNGTQDVLKDPLRETRICLKRGNFVDYRIVKVVAGKGGDGSLGSIKTRLGKVRTACGGNGGDGGNIYVCASTGLKSLNSVSTFYKAKDGIPGGKENMKGSRGADVDIKVPLGTMVKLLPEEPKLEPCFTLPQSYFKSKAKSKLKFYYSNKQSCDELLKTYYKFQNFSKISDLWIIRLLDEVCIMLKKRESYVQKKSIEFEINKEDDRVLIAKGGTGGVGSTVFWDQILGKAQISGLGEVPTPITIELELKMISDVGLAGLPNAGKSSIIAALSNSQPLIASYPFTTLRPNLCVVEFSDFWRMTVADIPGIATDAYENMGIGLSFLRHLERNYVLAYVIDLTSSSPCEDLETIKNEIQKYSSELAKKPYLIIANKADLGIGTKDNFNLLKLAAPGIEVIPISAKERKNIDKVALALRYLVSKYKPQE